MKIKHNDIIIPKENPFENCKLGRKPYAEVLTTLVSTYADGFVLAVNNEWGTGKTTFVKMWQQHLINAEFKTLYFNAWENDFDGNPLVALLSELKTLIQKTNEVIFKSLLKTGALLTKSIFPLLAKAVAEKYIDTKTITDAIGEITKSTAEILKDEIDEYANKKKGLLDFRAELEDFIKKTTDGKPLVFIIDELDRCRPNYAVEVLEHVKHFFSVPGIVFVLSIDKEQLANAIKGFYGSEHLNTTEYLRRFIDLEYVLPEPTTESYCNYLYDYFSFDDFLYSAERKKYNELMDDKESILKITVMLFEKENVTLRQQEKFFAHVRVVLNSFASNSYIYPTLLVMLIYIRNFSYEFYKKIRNRNINFQDLVTNVEELFPQNIDKYDLRLFISMEALLVVFYYNFYYETNRDVKLVQTNRETGEETVTVRSGVDQPDNSLFHNSIIDRFKGRWSNTKLDYLLDRIDLMKNIEA